MNPEIFCCQPFKNEWKLAVLLLFSKFSASFSYFWQFPGTKSGGKLAVLLLLSNFLRCISRILTNFRFFFQNFVNFSQKIFGFFFWFFDFFGKKSEKIVNPEIFCCQPFKNEWKLAVLLLFSKFSASLFIHLAVPRYQKWRKTSRFAAIFKFFALYFSDLDEFQTIFNFFRNFWKNLKKMFFFLKKNEKLWIQGFSAANHSKNEGN